jgi:hypothetical protein
MKWYKRDPAAALEGMLGLTIEERGAYNALIDLIYARAPRGGVTDQLVCKALGCRPQVWRRLKASLVDKGKVWESPPGNLLANRVVTEVVSAEFRTQNMARLGQVSALRRNEIKALVEGVWQKRDPTATLVIPRSKKVSKKESSFPTAAREPAEAKRVAEKRVCDLSKAELEQKFAAKRERKS